jgi:hypothetical protein
MMSKWHRGLKKWRSRVFKSAAEFAELALALGIACPWTDGSELTAFGSGFSHAIHILVRQYRFKLEKKGRRRRADFSNGISWHC